MRNRIFHIWDTSETVVGIASNAFGDGHFILSALHDEGKHTLRMLVDASDEKTGLFAIGHFIGFFDDDGAYQLFEIKDAEIIATDVSTLEVYAEHALYELTAEPLADIRPTNTTIGSAITQALTGTRWELGYAVDAGARSARGYYIDVHAFLGTAAETWGVELAYEIIVERNTVARRLVHARARLGAYRGRRFEYTRDTQSIKGYFSSSGIYTALIGRGCGEAVGETEAGNTTYGRRIKFDTVQWRKQAGDPADKPLGAEYIEDPEAKERWGFAGGTRNRVGFVVFGEITDPLELLQATWDRLQEVKQPVYSYKLSVTDLEQTNGAREVVRIGDMVAVIHRAVRPAIELEARVIKINRDLLSPDDTAIELGDARSTLSSAFVSVNKLAERAGGINDNGTFPTDLLQGAIDALKNRLVASGAYPRAQVLKNQGFLLENTDAGSEDFGALYLGPGILAIANRQQNGEWEWRTFGTGGGFTADEITAGTFNAGRVKIMGTGTYLDGTSLVVQHPDVAAKTVLDTEGMKLFSIGLDGSQTLIGGLFEQNGQIVNAANCFADAAFSQFSIRMGSMPIGESGAGLELRWNNQPFARIGLGFVDSFTTPDLIIEATRNIRFMERATNTFVTLGELYARGDVD